MRLTGNTILITGGGSGIGAGLAAALHDRGNRVIIAGRRREALDAVVRAHPGMASLPLDQSDPDGVDALTEQIVRCHPEVNVLVNNAGIMAAEDLSAPDRSLILAVCATNVIGPLLLTARLLPTLRRHPRAAIVNVSSALAFVPMAELPTYCATKAAMHSYTESLRLQLRDSNIQVIEIPPPRVYTEDGAQDDAHGVAVTTFVDETLALLAAHPSAPEIVVDAARLLRFADRRGEYEKVYATVNPVIEKGTP
jgi:uncharacterized oxidoreductase